jgi:hypothetical protein
MLLGAGHARATTLECDPALFTSSAASDDDACQPPAPLVAPAPIDTPSCTGPSCSPRPATPAPATYGGWSWQPMLTAAPRRAPQPTSVPIAGFMTGGPRDGHERRVERPPRA